MLTIGDATDICMACERWRWKCKYSTTKNKIEKCSVCTEDDDRQSFSWIGWRWCGLFCVFWNGIEFHSFVSCKLDLVLVFVVGSKNRRFMCVRWDEMKGSICILHVRWWWKVENEEEQTRHLILRSFLYFYLILLWRWWRWCSIGSRLDSLEILDGRWGKVESCCFKRRWDKRK